jgi:hypothetical protein
MVKFLLSHSFEKWKVMSWKKRVGDGDSTEQKSTLTTLSDRVRGTKKSSTPVTSDMTSEKGGPYKNIKTSNRNLVQGKERSVTLTVVWIV